MSLGESDELVAKAVRVSKMTTGCGAIVNTLTSAVCCCRGVLVLSVVPHTRARAGNSRRVISASGREAGRAERIAQIGDAAVHTHGMDQVVAAWDDAQLGCRRQHALVERIQVAEMLELFPHQVDVFPPMLAPLLCHTCPHFTVRDAVQWRQRPRPIANSQLQKVWPVT